MTKEGWRDLVIQAVTDSMHGDIRTLDLLAEYLAETDRAKQILRDLGYGCTGMGIERTVREIEECCCDG